MQVPQTPVYYMLVDVVFKKRLTELLDAFILCFLENYEFIFSQINFRNMLDSVNNIVNLE